MKNLLRLARELCQDPATDPAASRDDDPRLGTLLGLPLPGRTARTALIGFPYDLGVIRNGGRAGAHLGPAAIRAQLYRMTPDCRCHDVMLGVLENSLDLGDVQVNESLETAQQHLGRLVGASLRAGVIPIVLGGGHETAFGHFLGYVDADQPIHIINTDAHADVRPLVSDGGHSGSPFRQALEHPSGHCRSYGVMGLQPQSNAKAYIDFLAEKACRRQFAADTDRGVIESMFDDCDGPAWATFCLDALDQSLAPGVSAPAGNGLHLDQWLAAIDYAAASTHVCSFDIVELSPPFDRNHQTARIAALSVWRILRGIANRDR